MPLYRKVNHDRIRPIYHPHKTRRDPQSVPYLVDNIWEWLRPEAFPSRRYSAFASPSKAYVADTYVMENGVVCKVELIPPFSLAQLQPFTDRPSDEGPHPPHADAKHHPDVKTLPGLILGALGRDKDNHWPSLPLSQKRDAGLLFLPCLSKEEVEDLFTSTPLANIRGEVEAACRFWNDAEHSESVDDLQDPIGEVFFYPEGGYRLIPDL